MKKKIINALAWILIGINLITLVFAMRTGEAELILTHIELQSFVTTTFALVCIGVMK